MDLRKAFEEFKSKIEDAGLTCEDLCLELSINPSIFLTVEFEDDDLNTIQVYGTGLETMLTDELQGYLDDEDLCREVPVDLFINEMAKQFEFQLVSYDTDEL